MTVYVREKMEDLGNWERQFARTLFRDLRKISREAAQTQLRPLRMRTIRVDAVHTSKFGRSWKIKSPNKWTTVIYNRARNAKNKYHYGLVIEGGRRRKARMPPPKALERWVQDKRPGLVEMFGVKGASFIVARAIRDFGIRPRPIMTAPKIQKKMARVMLRGYSRMWVRAAERARLASPKRKPRVPRGSA